MMRRSLPLGRSVLNRTANGIKTQHACMYIYSFVKAFQTLQTLIVSQAAVYELYSVNGSPPLWCSGQFLATDGQSGAGAGFLRVLQYPLPIFSPPVSPQSSPPIIRGCYNRPVVAAVPKVPPHKLKENN
jgi:hypothetical protein